MLSKAVGREIPYIPCQGHRSNTIVEHSSNASPLVISFFTHLQSLYVFFTGGAKRNEVIVTNLRDIEHALKLRNLSKTRLAARAEYIQAVCVSFEAIVEVLKEIKDSGDSTRASPACKLLNNTFTFRFYHGPIFH